ncbi:MAG: hypothetical protein M5U29_12135 [Anaerolineae bacterium]|nr:hypothetical protein [Anaerolineae bacterium]
MSVRLRPPTPRARTVAALIVLLALVGLALRLGLLVRAGWRYDYDEGMVGLQVLRILRGERPVFHPGQPYLAALESYLIAPFFAVFGASAVTLKLVPWLLAGLYTAATGWLGWRAFDRRVGALSALLTACAPSYLLITGMKAWGATAETLVLGTLSLVAASYIVEEGQPPAVRARALLLLGFLSGVGFWVSWLMVFYALPIAAVLAWHGRETPCRAWCAAGLTFALGSAPLWWHNLGHDWATFRYLLRSQGDTWGNLRPVLDHLTYDLAPRLVSGDPRWHVLSWDAVWGLQIVYEGGLIALALWAWRGPWPRARRPARVLLALFALILPPIYVLSGYGNHALNEFGFDATGRYVLMLHSVLPIGAAALSVWLARRGSLTRFAAAGALTLRDRPEPARRAAHRPADRLRLALLHSPAADARSADRPARRGGHPPRVDRRGHRPRAHVRDRGAHSGSGLVRHLRGQGPGAFPGGAAAHLRSRARRLCRSRAAGPGLDPLRASLPRCGRALPPRPRHTLPAGDHPARAH